jgi:hypothetical protein
MVYLFLACALEDPISMYYNMDTTSIRFLLSILCTPNPSAGLVQCSSCLPFLAVRRKCQTSGHVFGLLDPQVMGCTSCGQEVGQLLQGSHVWDLHDNLHSVVKILSTLDVIKQALTFRMCFRSSRYATVSARSRVSCKTADVACATCAVRGPTPQLWIRVSAACTYEQHRAEALRASLFGRRSA